MLLYIVLYIILAYLMFAALSNAVCLYAFFLQLIFADAFCYALSWFIDT